MRAAGYVGRVISAFATPGDAYLQRIGELAYGVSSLEWTLLGDLHRLSAHLPTDLTVANLAGRTTGGIAQRLRAAVPSVAHGATALYLSTGADALAEVSEIRNAVLHARPATIDGQQRLYRWRSRPSEAYAITDEWLDENLRRIAELSRAVRAVRPPLTL